MTSSQNYLNKAENANFIVVFANTSTVKKSIVITETRKQAKKGRYNMTYYGKTITDFVFDGYDGELNRVILVTDDGMTHEEYLTNDEFDELAEKISK